jgi:hypothetical protein
MSSNVIAGLRSLSRALHTNLTRRFKTRPSRLIRSRWLSVGPRASAQAIAAPRLRTGDTDTNVQ